VVVESHDDFPHVEISITGGVGEMVREISIAGSVGEMVRDLTTRTQPRLYRLFIPTTLTLVAHN